MAEPQAVRAWLSGLARGNRRWIQGTVAAGTVAGIATIVQMVLLARIVHQGVVEGVTVGDLTGLFVGLVGVLALRALAQGFQTRLAARCSERVQQDARRTLNRHWRATGPVALKKQLNLN